MVKTVKYDAKSEFIRVTAQRYDSMVARLRKKNLPPVTFTKDDFRRHIAHMMGGTYDGVIQCRYCNMFFTVPDIAVDHANPLSRGGSTDLDNIEYPCKKCNSRKGSLTPTEYLDLLDFLEKKIPFGRQDILNRLEISVQLVTSVRANAGVIGDLKRSGHWKQAQQARRKRK